MADDPQPITARQIGLVLEAARTLAVVLDLDQLLPQMARAACDVLGCRRASVWLHEPDRRVLSTRVALEADPITVPDTAGIVGAALAGNAVLNIPRPYHDPRFNPDSDRRSGFRTESLLAAPLVDLTGRPVGVVQAVNKADGGPFTAVDEQLIRLLADQAAVAVQRQRLHDAAAQAAAMRRELELAQSVQQALVPKEAPAVPGLRAAGWTRPASITGGDCYDLWPLPDGRLAALVADASGHGIGPALIVSQVRTMARLLCESADADPADVLQRINRRLEVDLASNQFVTAALAFVDGTSGAIAYASAGHGPSLLQRSPADAVEPIDSNGLPLGVLPDCFDAADGPPTRTFRLDPGGCLLLLSDGVFEAFAPDGRLFGVEPVIAEVGGRNGSPDRLIATLRRSLDGWVGTNGPQDDQTLVVIERDQSKPEWPLQRPLSGG